MMRQRTARILFARFENWNRYIAREVVSGIQLTCLNSSMKRLPSFKLP